MSTASYKKKKRHAMDPLIKAEKKREKDVKQLFIRDLPQDVTKIELQELSPDIVSCLISKKRRKRHAFVRFASEEKAEENFDILKEKKLRGENLNIDYAGEKSLRRNLEISKNFNVKKLYVSGLPTSCTIFEVAKFFPKAYTITVQQSDTFRSAYVAFASEEECTEAFNATKELEIGGQTVSVHHSAVAQLRKQKTEDLYESVKMSAKSDTLCLGQRDFMEALKDYSSYGRRENFSIPDVTWKNVWAREDVKKRLRSAILWPLKHGKIYEENKIPLTKGILLYGPYGCGKKLVAQAIANEGSLYFHNVYWPKLLSMYPDEIKRSIQKTFLNARSSSPCIIYVDEFALSLSMSNNESAEIATHQLLYEMERIPEHQLIFIFVATYSIEEISSAMLKPGRFQEKIFLDLPSSAGRVDILRSLTKNKSGLKISEDLDLETIACDKRCEGFSGADLALLIREATSKAVEEIIDSANPILILQKIHFDRAFGAMKPFREKDLHG